MLDWIGSLTIREHSSRKIVLCLSRSTRLLGIVLLGAGTIATWRLWPLSPWLALLPMFVAFAGLTLFTLQRELVIDREAGVLRVDQSAFGVSNRAVVPLFHLRAVVVVAKSGAPVGEGALDFLSGGRRYVAYLDRRVGDAIYLDESRRRAGLWRMAEAIADVAELRLEYEASPSVAASKDN